MDSIKSWAQNQLGPKWPDLQKCCVAPKQLHHHLKLVNKKKSLSLPLCCYGNSSPIVSRCRSGWAVFLVLLWSTSNSSRTTSTLTSSFAIMGLAFSISPMILFRRPVVLLFDRMSRMWQRNLVRRARVLGWVFGHTFLRNKKTFRVQIVEILSSSPATTTTQKCHFSSTRGFENGSKKKERISPVNPEAPGKLTNFRADGEWRWDR